MSGKLTLLLPWCCVLLAGCPLQPLEVPSLLDAVLEEKTAFRPSEDNALLDVAPGTAIDDVQERLAGCWGKFLDDDGEALITLSGAIQFRADGGYETWGLQYDVLGLLPFLFGEAGTYEVLEPGRLRLRAERRWSQSPGGTLQEEDVKLPEQTALLTLSGDSMMFVLGSDDPNSVPTEQRIYYIYRRFECP
jgi:hypothetical protein